MFGQYVCAWFLSAYGLGRGGLTLGRTVGVGRRLGGSAPECSGATTEVPDGSWPSDRPQRLAVPLRTEIVAIAAYRQATGADSRTVDKLVDRLLTRSFDAALADRGLQ